jgi:hypothetical protein
VSETVPLAQLVLAATFGLAAVAKLALGARFVEALRLGGFVRPDRVAVARWAVPSVELALAALLLAGGSARVAAVAAIAVLAVFSLTGWRRIRRAGPLPCACFGGATGGATFDRGTLLRNAVLAAYALGVVITGGAEGAEALREFGRGSGAYAVQATALSLLPFVAGRIVGVWDAARELADEDVLTGLRARGGIA